MSADLERVRDTVSLTIFLLYLQHQGQFSCLGHSMLHPFSTTDQIWPLEGMGINIILRSLLGGFGKFIQFTDVS